MSKFDQEIINRIMGKALYHLIRDTVHPDSFAVIDKESNTHVVIFIDPEDNKLKIHETTEIHPDNDCTIADLIMPSDLSTNRTLN